MGFEDFQIKVTVVWSLKYERNSFRYQICGGGQGDRGTGGGSLGEKGAGGVQEAGEDGAGSRRTSENYATLHNILQSKKDKEVGGNRNNVGSTGSGRFKPPEPHHKSHFEGFAEICFTP